MNLLERMVKQRSLYWYGVLCIFLIAISTFAIMFAYLSSYHNIGDALFFFIAIAFLLIILIFIFRKYKIEENLILEDIEHLKLQGNKSIGKVQSSEESIPITRVESFEYYLCTAEVNGEVKIFKSLPKRNYKTNRNVGELCAIYYDDANYYVDIEEVVGGDELA